MFSQDRRCLYRRNPLGEVICQFRFPDILSISTTPPAEFQEAIRSEYPGFSRREESPPPKVTGIPGHFALNNPPTVVNYQFSTLDGVWRVNLTAGFISLSCSRYTCWEDFAARLDKILAAFIRIYSPACFQRIGLRYVNFFSRKALGLEDTPFRSMFAPCYLGPLAEPDVIESNTTRCSVDTEMSLRGGCRVKIHAGPGMVKKPGPDDKEIKFVFDQDLFIQGQIAVNLSAGALHTLHAHAGSVFCGAITPIVHNAMEPTEI